MLTLAQAATMTGMNRSTILRAIKRVAITGTKGHNDVWQVNGAEQARAFPVTPPNTQLAPQDTQYRPAVGQARRPQRPRREPLMNANAVKSTPPPPVPVSDPDRRSCWLAGKSIVRSGGVGRSAPGFSA